MKKIELSDEEAHQIELMLWSDLMSADSDIRRAKSYNPRIQKEIEAAEERYVFISNLINKVKN